MTITGCSRNYIVLIQLQTPPPQKERFIFQVTKGITRLLRVNIIKNKLCVALSSILALLRLRRRLLFWHLIKQSNETPFPSNKIIWKTEQYSHLVCIWRDQHPHHLHHHLFHSQLLLVVQFWIQLAFHEISSFSFQTNFENKRLIDNQFYVIPLLHLLTNYESQNTKRKPMLL